MMLIHAGSTQERRSAPPRAQHTGSTLGQGAVLRAARAAGRGAVAADRDRHLAPVVVTALQEAGFARHFVPRRWGGEEGGFADLISTTVLVAGQCPSAAWCGMLFAAHGRYAARLPEDAQRELWEAGPDTLIAAALAPAAGTARPVPGGWLLDGRWECVSGVDFCDWVLLASPVDDAAGAAGAAPAARVLAVPRGEVIVHDTWHSTGLRGTGSNGVEVRGVFVPDRRTCPLGDVLGAVVEPGSSPARQASGHLAGGAMLCAPALGAARRAVRSWIRWARTAPAGRPAAAADPAVQRALARSAAEIDAVALLLDRAGAAADAEPTAARVEAVNRRDAAVAAELLVEAVERLFRMGGAHVRDDTSEVQRAWRDIHTVAAHGALRLDAAAGGYAAWGRSQWPVPMVSGPR